MAGQSSAQRQIDTRALEIASGAQERIKAHEEHCNGREAAAALSRSEMRQDMQDGFKRLEDTVTELGKVVHRRISDEKDARYRLILAVAATVILLLLGTSGTLFVRAAGWS